MRAGVVFTRLGLISYFPDIDHVSLGEGLDIPKQSIGVASKADGMNGIDGILGIGPVDLTQG